MKPVSFVPLEMLWENAPFWLFVVLMALGSTAFNVVNSASDAICINILGKILILSVDGFLTKINVIWIFQVKETKTNTASIDCGER